MNIVKYPSPILFRVADVVQEAGIPAVKAVVPQILALILAHGGLGLSAPQCGISQRFFVLNLKRLKKYCVVPPGTPRAMIDPVVVDMSPECDEVMEGCLSEPAGPRGSVRIMRHVWVKVVCVDEDGKACTVVAKGMLAWCIQHEIDHLNGISIVQRGEQQTELRKQAIELAKKNRLEQLKGLEIGAADAAHGFYRHQGTEVAIAADVKPDVFVDPFPNPDGKTCPECKKPWKPEGRYRVCAPCRERVGRMPMVMVAAMMASLGGLR